MMVTERANISDLAVDEACEGDVAGTLAPLMQIMLGVIARCQEALLQEDSESLLVIGSTLAHLCGPEPQSIPGDDRRQLITSQLGRLLDRVLDAPDQAWPQRVMVGPAAASAASVETTAGRELLHQGELTHWFHRLSVLLVKTHPRAVEMLRLRFTGLGSREIAAQLNLPPRLVHQTLTVLRERRDFLSDGQEHGA